MNRSPQPRRRARLLAMVAIAIGALVAPPARADAAAPHTSTVVVGLSGGARVGIQLVCGGTWRTVNFTFVATRSTLSSRPVGGSRTTWRDWNSRNEAYILYACERSYTNVTYRFTGRHHVPGAGVV